MAKSATQKPAGKTTSKKTSEPEMISSETEVDEGQEIEEGGEFEPALKELFTDSIKDIYWAEKHLIKALPKMVKAATTEELKAAITEHITETEGHVTRLEQVFELLGEKVQAKKCDAMEGLIKEGESIVEDTEEGTATRDVGIILASQKIEHYEIATYGGLAQLATTLGLDDIASILSETLEEEKAADQKLTQVAEESINYQASEEEA